MSYGSHLSRTAVALLALGVLGCTPKSGDDGNETDGGQGSGGSSGAATIVATGSDTMVNVAQAWAEEYGKENPDVSVQVIGGGSGVGIAALIDSTTAMANASRAMKDKEKALLESKRGEAAKEFIVGYDALAVYVPKDSPIDSISIEELAEIYGDGGKIDEWSGISDTAASLGKIVRVSRQNSSGTFAYFREAVLGKGRDYKDGSLDQSGSKDVVELVSKTPGAIGYSGMGYATPAVKMLKISREKGGEAVAPTLENAKSGAYPITRPLYIYTAGEPTGALKAYLDWIMSEAGQKVVTDLGYVPVK